MPGCAAKSRFANRTKCSGLWACGHYRIVKELGRGAMGLAFEAFDPAIGRTVALKVIRFQPLATADALRWRLRALPR